jgi:hypothetical protein
VRITGRSGQRIFTSRAKSMPSMTPRSWTSAKIIATSRPPISRVASAASALSHSMFVFEQGRRQIAEFGVVSALPPIAAEFPQRTELTLSGPSVEANCLLEVLE